MIKSLTKYNRSLNTMEPIGSKKSATTPLNKKCHRVRAPKGLGQHNQPRSCSFCS